MDFSEIQYCLLHSYTGLFPGFASSLLASHQHGTCTPVIQLFFCKWNYQSWHRFSLGDLTAKFYLSIKCSLIWWCRQLCKSIWIVSFLLVSDFLFFVWLNQRGLQEATSSSWQAASVLIWSPGMSCNSVSCIHQKSKFLSSPLQKRGLGTKGVFNYCPEGLLDEWFVKLTPYITYKSTACIMSGYAKTLTHDTETTN